MTKRPTLILALLFACTTSDPAPTSDAGTDAERLSDASLDADLEDTGLEDTGLEDAGLEDAGLEDAGALPASAIGEAVCPFVAACGTGSRFVASCMRSYTDDDWVSEITNTRRAHAAAVVPCVLEATNCEEYFACVRTDEVCTENRCEGSVLAGCRNGFVERFDCAADGVDCVESDVDPARCGLAGTMCGRDELSCEGNISLWCPVTQQQTPFAFNCDLQGKVCSGGFCADSGPVACTEGTCSEDGMEISYCVAGIATTFRCDSADSGHRCFVGPDDETICGIPTAEACEESARCEGDVAVVCTHGKEYELDCARAGAACVDEDATCVLPE